jgi:ATP-dependent Zn protease
MRHASRRFTEKDEIATAYHEAGHVVAAVRLGVRVKKATIIGDGRYYGIVHCADVFGGLRLDVDRSSRARTRVERQVILSLAGPAAEAEFLGRPIKGNFARADYQTALDVADHMCSSSEEAQAYLKWLEIRARDLIKVFWPDVEKVSSELTKNKTLTRETIKSLLR